MSSSGVRSRSPKGNGVPHSDSEPDGTEGEASAPLLGQIQSTPVATANHNNRSSHDASASASAAAPPAPGPDAEDPVEHLHAGLYKDAPPTKLDQPVTATVAHHLPRGTRVRRLALRLLKWDTAASTVLHRASLFPFDLLLVPFAMVCGIYGMPFVIPALALVESPRLALQVLVSTVLTALLTTIGKRTTKRLRPAPASLARKFFDLRRLEHNFSFPSGDSAQGAVLGLNLALYAAAALAAAAPPAAAATTTAAAATAATALSPYLFLLLTPLVMTSRVYFGAHWWSDTFGGAAFGAAATMMTWKLLPPLMGWRQDTIGAPVASGHDLPFLLAKPLMALMGFRQ